MARSDTFPGIIQEHGWAPINFMPEPRSKCTQCGAEILAATAERNGGLCMPCKKQPRPDASSCSLATLSRCVWFIGCSFNCMAAAEHSFSLSSAAKRVKRPHGESTGGAFSWESERAMQTCFKRLLPLGAVDPARTGASLPACDSHLSIKTRSCFLEIRRPNPITLLKTAMFTKVKHARSGARSLSQTY